MTIFNPFASARLVYRSIREADIALFRAIDADADSYVKSNPTNISLPSENDTAEAFKHATEESLLGAVIWLPHAKDITPDAVRELKETNPYGEAMVEDYGTAIGQLHLTRSDPGEEHHRSTDILINILPGYQGKGYGGEAIEWALDYTFRRANLHRMVIRAFEYNHGAVRLYERLGFVHEGRERKAYWHEGRWWDGVMMSMLEDEYWELQKKKGGKELTVNTKQA